VCRFDNNEELFLYFVCRFDNYDECFCILCAGFDNDEELFLYFMCRFEMMMNCFCILCACLTMMKNCFFSRFDKDDGFCILVILLSSFSVQV
jgi:hypothetical protein